VACPAIGIKFTGLGEGEKLTEELFYETEEVHPTPLLSG
jgi:FlaA1/EpsC-like NDP-sugar epimerase